MNEPDSQPNSGNPFSMSSNPYASSESTMAVPLEPIGKGSLEAGDRFPTAITVIAVVLLVFGIIGIPTGILNFLQGLLFRFLPNNLDGNEGAFMLQAMSQAMPVYMLNGVLNFLLSIGLIVAATGLFKHRIWGAKLAVMLCFAAILYKIIEGVGTFYAQSIMMEKMQSGMMKQASGNSIDSNVMRWSMFIGMIIGLLIFSTPLVIFYGWAAYYLGRHETRRYLA